MSDEYEDRRPFAPQLAEPKVSTLDVLDDAVLEHAS